jgi:hypothetical protein
MVRHRVGRVAEQHHAAGTGPEAVGARQRSQLADLLRHQVLGPGRCQQRADRLGPAGEPAAQQGQLGRGRLGARRSRGRGHPVDAAVAGRAAAQRHGDEAVAGAQRLAAGGLVRGQLGNPVAGDDRLPGGEAGTDGDGLRGQRAADPAVDAVGRDQQVGGEAGVTVGHRRGLGPAGADPGHGHAGTDVHPVTEPGHQRVVEVLEVHDRRSGTGAGPAARRDDPLPVRAAHPAVGQR